MLHQMKCNAATTTENEISTCRQFLGHECNYNYFDTAIFVETSLTQNSSIATELPENDINENTTPNFLTQNNGSQAYMRPPKNLQSTFVSMLDHWIQNKHDDTLVVGSLAHKFRKKWMGERGVNDDFSKRKIIILKMIRVVATNLSLSDKDAAIMIDQDRISKNMTTTDYWKKCYNKSATFCISSINTTLAEI